MTPYVSIDRLVKRATLDQLLALYTEKNSALRKLGARIVTNLGKLSQDESLELANRYDELEDDCTAIATAIADRMTDPKHQEEAELAYA